MFTGIVQSLGRIESVRAQAQDRDLVVHAPEVCPRLTVGASVAIDGVCQTVTRLEEARFEVHAIAETLRVTTLGKLRAGDPVNLESALGAGDPLGGHFVQGHVDGVAHLVSRTARGDSVTLRFEAEPELVNQLVPKGSVAVDGISLTVGPQIDERQFEVYLIPHTLEVTTLGRRQPGDAVNLETDVLGKYVQHYLGLSGGSPGITEESLRRAGWDESGASPAEGGR